MNSGSSGMVWVNTVTTGTSGTEGAVVEAASLLQPNCPVRPRANRIQSRLNVIPWTRLLVFLLAIRRPNGTIRLLRPITHSTNSRNFIHDTTCQATGGDELGPLLMKLPQQILPIGINIGHG